MPQHPSIMEADRRRHSPSVVVANGAAPKPNFGGLGSGATIVSTSMDESSEFDASQSMADEATQVL